METRIIEKDQIKSVYVLNTWNKETLEEAYQYLDNGYYVHFGSSCIGHTMAEIVEHDGIDLAKSKYGDRAEVVRRDGWGTLYVHLK